MAEGEASEWAERFLQGVAAGADAMTDEQKASLRQVGALLCHVAQGAIDDGGGAAAVILTVAGAWSAITNGPR